MDKLTPTLYLLFYLLTEALTSHLYYYFTIIQLTLTLFSMLLPASLPSHSLIFLYLSPPFLCVKWRRIGLHRQPNPGTLP